MAYLSIATITNAVAGLTVTGLTLKDLNGIPEQVDARDCPLLYPKPDQLVTNLKIDPITFGNPSVSQKLVTYNLTFVFLHSLVGAERGLFATYPDMVNVWAAFLDALTRCAALQSGRLRVTVPGSPVFGQVFDPSGKQFHGSYIDLGVRENLPR